MNSVFWNLVAKDLKLYSWLVLIALAVGAASLLLLPHGNVAFFVGVSIGMASFVLLIMMTVIWGINEERKHQIHLFVLSQPITGQGVVLAKMLAVSITVLVPWLLISGGAIGMFLSNPDVHGFIPFAVTVLLFFPVYHAVMLSVAVTRQWAGLTIPVAILFNVGLNLFIPGVLRIPSVGATIEGSEMIWVSELQMIIALEIGIAVLAPALVLLSLRKRKEFL